MLAFIAAKAWECGKDHAGKVAILVLCVLIFRMMVKVQT